MVEKIAVVLFNLGGPDSREAIQPFLYNFFTDKNIIRVPQPFRSMIAALIAYRRTRKEAGSSYERLGYVSPLLKNTQAQADALKNVLDAHHGQEYKIFVSMRYWHPMSKEVVQQVQGYNPDRIILLPLYPQYSTTTTRSSYQQWLKYCDYYKLNKPTRLICCYPTEQGFVQASAELIRDIYLNVPVVYKKPRVLFSAHGLPESIIKEGDPYQWQCEESACIIASAMGIENLDWQICYQSRVGPKKWIGPSTEEALQQAAKDNVPVVIYPHAFVNEHVETLVEIEEEYRHLAHEYGVPYFARVPTVSVHHVFITGLARMILNQADRSGITTDRGEKICPSSFSECCMTEFCNIKKTECGGVHAGLAA